MVVVMTNIELLGWWSWNQWRSCHRDPKELHKNIDATGSVDQLDYLEQVLNTCDTDATAAAAASDAAADAADNGLENWNELVTVLSWFGNSEGRERRWGD